MSEIQPFTFPVTAQAVRVLELAGEPWFVAADVCTVLGITNVGNVLARLDDDEKDSIHLPDGTRGNPNRAIVNEPGLYSLLFRSDKPEAKQFKRWVTHDVLPAIRRAGGYVSPAATLEQRAAILGINEAQARVLHALSGIVDQTWLESKARHLAARALGEEPDEDPEKRLLTVGEYLEEKGLTAAATRKLSSRFGRQLKAQYVGRHGRPPGTSRRFVSGAQRDVAVYTEADRDLFDAVWSQFADATAA